jgi:hypothetical protein
MRDLKKLLICEDSLWDKLEKKFITNPSTPLAASWEEWDNIRELQKKNQPIAFFIFQTLPTVFSRVKSTIENCGYWVKYRMINKHKYHLINTKLSPGYYDYDTRILFGVFSMFVEFIEEHNQYSGLKEQIKLYKNYVATADKSLKDCSESTRKTQKKKYKFRLQMWQDFEELYTWWKDERTANYDLLNKDFDDYYAKHNKNYNSELYNLLCNREEELKATDDIQLLKLLKYRQHLWV